MDIIGILLVLLVVGVGMWLVATYCPKPASTIILVILGVVVLLVLLSATGAIPQLSRPLRAP